MPIFFTLVLVSLFGWLAYYAYQTYYVQKQEAKKFSDIANANPNNKSISVFMFHVDWCPHCKTAKPEWRSFCDNYNGKPVNGYTIECKDFNCTDDSNTLIKSALLKYKIESYPTIKAVMIDNDGKEIVIDYDAKVNSKNLEKFIMSVSN
jgi:thiol-disulfide isomerase/thioredoxin